MRRVFMTGLAIVCQTRFFLVQVEQTVGLNGLVERFAMLCKALVQGNGVVGGSADRAMGHDDELTMS